MQALFYVQVRVYCKFNADYNGLYVEVYIVICDYVNVFYVGLYVEVYIVICDC